MDDREGGNDPRTSRRPDRFTSRQNFWDLAKIVKSVARQCDVNACIGAAVGLVFLAIGGPKEWMLPIALAVTVLLSTYGGGIPVMWRQAPIPAAIVIASGVAHQSKLSGIEQGFTRSPR
ncbi:MAG: hypothetical protein NTY18_10655 [Deltaproteobacteria bacterium]|nr:hypothetical protein [Deltaproteobacteria bacterium]